MKNISINNRDYFYQLYLQVNGNEQMTTKHGAIRVMNSDGEELFFQDVTFQGGYHRETETAIVKILVEKRLKAIREKYQL